jgi:peptidoglycan/xylan/chitin deacetylase (PgdA/CDA1 family)
MRRVVNKPVALIALALLTHGASLAQVASCQRTVYLSFDTGSQSQAQLIAATLKQFSVKATFFLANEKTVRGDYSLDPAWASYWRERVAEGHAFGSHTFDHVVAQGDLAHGHIQVKAQFGAAAGRKLNMSAAQYCQQLRQVDQRFFELTGRKLDPIWRAPAGRLTRNARQAASACGYRHVGWSPAGFSGDELPSKQWPNPVLLQRMLRDLKDGDIIMAHMGIWSRQDPWAPANLAPLIQGLQQKGFCFATLREYHRPEHSDHG